MFSTLIKLLSGVFGHLLGDPTHQASASAITSVMQAGAIAHESNSPTHLDDLIEEVDQLLSLGRAVTVDEWNHLKSVADKHIEAIRSTPVPTPVVSPAPAPTEASAPVSVSPGAT